METITLPEGIISIESEAFNDITDKLTVVLKSPNTSLADDAFDSNNKATLYLPEGNLASVSALKQDVKVKYASTWIVRYNFSASEYVTEVVEDGKRAYGPDPSVIEKNTPKGMKFVGWTDADKLLCVTEDLEVSAIFEEDPTNNGNGSGDNSGDDGNNGGSGGNGGIGNNGSTGNNGNTGGTSSDKDDDDDDDDDDKKKHTLTVVYGNGSGTYKKGATVIISAIEPPAGKEFYKWTTTNTGLTITSATSAATTVKMTDSDATVTATYRDKSSVSGNSSKPISKKENPATEVQITKPGISSTDKAYASVKGSTDNFVVKITESAEAANAVATALAYEYADMEPIKYFAMDISLYDKKGNKVTNTNGLSVDITMPIPDQLVQYGGNNKVGAVVNNSTLEKLNCKFTTVSGVPCVTFTATHFSPYTIYVDTSNLSANVIDSSPKTGDGIHPKWFLSLGLACLSIVLFMKKDKVTSRKVVA